MLAPYYADESVALYHGDCREIAAWLTADVLVTDPPYGRAWQQRSIAGKGAGRGAGKRSDAHGGIRHDVDTSARDRALDLWGSSRPALVFGDLMLPPPAGVKLVGVYQKPSDSGVRGAVAGVRRDGEALYWIGPWPNGIGGRSSVFQTGTRIAGAHGLAGEVGHPHAKPLDLLTQLVATCQPGVIADPFAGSGSTLVAAKHLGRKAIGIEIDERYCEIAARRLAQDVLGFGGVA